MLRSFKDESVTNATQPRLILPYFETDSGGDKNRVPGRESGTHALGMMQPYFFPYVGYFSLIHATKHWVVFDTAQYMRRAWVNRNRVLSDRASCWNYLRVPVLHAARESSICDVMIDQKQPWIRQLFRQLDIYRLRRAPFFDTVTKWLHEILPDYEQRCSGRLSPLLYHLIRATCEYIGLPFRGQIFSEMDLGLPSEMAAGDWAFEVSKLLGFRTYVNAPGGQELFDSERFEQAGIRLLFLQPVLKPYPQGGAPFIPGLSILDVLMWNSPVEVLNLVRQYSLREPLVKGDLAA